MFSFWQKKNVVSIGEILKGDMHSHLIPGIDDGSKDLSTSLYLLEQFQKLGYTKIVTTPHIYSGLYNNTSRIIKNDIELLKKNAIDSNINLDIEAAAEYLIDPHFEELIKNDDILYFGHSKFVLIEMSFAAPSANIDSVIFKLITKGLQPVLAHPERYSYWYDSFQHFKRLKDMGCLFQINLLSLLSYYGTETKKIALLFFKNNWVDFVGTDLHNEKHIQFILKYQFNSELCVLLSKANLKNSVI